jgi:hypothetical protein
LAWRVLTTERFDDGRFSRECYEKQVGNADQELQETWGVGGVGICGAGYGAGIAAGSSLGENRQGMTL